MLCSRKLPFIQQGGEGQCDSTGALSAQQEISWKMIQKIRTKISGGKSYQTEITGNKFLKLGILRTVFFFSGNSRKCCSIRCLKFPEIQTAILHRRKVLLACCQDLNVRPRPGMESRPLDPESAAHQPLDLAQSRTFE